MQNAPDNFPDVIRIETSGKCNFKCIHCPTGTQPNKRPVLSKDRFNYIVNQFIDNKFVPRVVVLYHGGEPLLNKNLSHYIRTFKEMGVIKTVITTNASLLNEELSKKLITAGLDEMKISFDGQDPDENNHIRLNGNFHTNAANVKTFCKIRKTLGCNNPNIIISNVQICDKITLQTLYKNHHFTFQDAPTYLTKYFSDEYDEIEFKSYPAMIWPGFEKFGVLDVVHFPTDKPNYCGPLFETSTILSNGNVVPCCYDLKEELILGNIFEENIFDIWQNEKYNDLRSNFRRQQYHKFCRKCNVVSPRYLCNSLPA
jgi:radical SAM protein with 4Fe4S-binding SPASM domain